MSKWILHTYTSVCLWTIRTYTKRKFICIRVTLEYGSKIIHYTELYLLALLVCWSPQYEFHTTQHIYMWYIRIYMHTQKKTYAAQTHDTELVVRREKKKYPFNCSIHEVMATPSIISRQFSNFPWIGHTPAAIVQCIHSTVPL